MLDFVENIKPIGNDMWKRVSEEYNRVARANVWEERDDDSLKAKFKGFVNNRKPTGDPNCPTLIGASDFEKDDLTSNDAVFEEVESSINDGSISPTPGNSPATVSSPANSLINSKRPSSKKTSPFQNKRTKFDLKIASIDNEYKHEEEFKDMKLEMKGFKWRLVIVSNKLEIKSRI
ncbi:hypothetical protein BC833DRAFT_625153 [Globomyces pollinis-pini]|nr:hypothetical protein BC833DRAFT_625153 [Globomyces pollinis-pini]